MFASNIASNNEKMLCMDHLHSVRPVPIYFLSMRSMFSSLDAYLHKEKANRLIQIVKS